MAKQPKDIPYYRTIMVSLSLLTIIVAGAIAFTNVKSYAELNRVKIVIEEERNDKQDLEIKDNEKCNEHIFRLMNQFDKNQTLIMRSMNIEPTKPIGD